MKNNSWWTERRMAATNKDNMGKLFPAFFGK